MPFSHGATPNTLEHPVHGTASQITAFRRQPAWQWRRAAMPCDCSREADSSTPDQPTCTRRQSLQAAAACAASVIASGQAAGDWRRCAQHEVKEYSPVQWRCSTVLSLPVGCSAITVGCPCHHRQLVTSPAWSCRGTAQPLLASALDYTHDDVGSSTMLHGCRCSWHWHRGAGAPAGAESAGVHPEQWSALPGAGAPQRAHRVLPHLCRCRCF